METDDSPPVSLIILTFNQQTYVGQAIEAALSQNYPDLEIIVSDDNSTDRTYDIAKDYAEHYIGQHKFSVRRNERNVGSFLHLLQAVDESRGELIVVAAGDDISKPERVRSQVYAWQRSRAWGQTSRYDIIDENSHCMAVNQRAEVLFKPEYRLRRYFFASEGPVGIVHGCTSAYDRKLFDQLKASPDDYILSEDGTLSVIINMLGQEIIVLEDSLVCYRQHSDSLTHGRSRQEVTLERIRKDERAIERMATSQANRCKYFLRMNERLDIPQKRRLNVEEIKADLDVYEVRARWRAMSVIEKFSFIARHGRPANLKWAIPRLIDVDLFLRGKYFLRKHVSGRKAEDQTDPASDHGHISS